MCVLTVPGPGDVFTLHTDASAAGVAGVLNVVREGVEKPVSFYSKQLQGAERRYSASELEGLAVFRADIFFAHYLYGREFKIITDHTALVTMFKGKALNRRIHGWALRLHDYDFEVVYRKGVANSNADGLSRQAWTGPEDDVDEDVLKLSGGRCGGGTSTESRDGAVAPGTINY